MNINGKTKAIINKIEQNKAGYNLERKIAKIFALSSEMLVNKYF